jgi:hypothetical protein
MPFRLPRFRLTCLGLFVATAAEVFGQSADWPSIPPPPPVANTQPLTTPAAPQSPIFPPVPQPPASPSQPSVPAAPQAAQTPASPQAQTQAAAPKDSGSANPPAPGAAETSDQPITLEGPPAAPAVAGLADFLGYRYATGALEWIPGGGNQFGMFSIDWDHYQKAGIASGLDAGMEFHFLSGPDNTDMPARVYDFSLGYQHRDRLGPLAFDVAASVLAASDFIGSARKGVLFPAHAVGFLSVLPEMNLVFGVDYLDRGDVKLLPVGGLIWTPRPDMRYELVFPRPRAVFQLTEDYRVYLAGELGGGSWAVERVAFFNDLATYRDLRLCIGLEWDDKKGPRPSFEIGYLFDRSLKYSSGIGNMRLDDAVMFSLVTPY